MISKSYCHINFYMILFWYDKHMKGEKEMEKYNEIFRLKDMLDKAEIDYTFNNLYDGYQIKIDYIGIQIFQNLYKWKDHEYI